MLHFNKESSKVVNSETYAHTSQTQKQSPDIPTADFRNQDTSVSLRAEVNNSTILLSPAQVYALVKDNRKIIIRCLIDNGSQSHLITAKCCKKLNLPIIPLSNSVVKGIGSSSRPIIGHVNLEIESRIDSKNKYKLHALVVDKITDQLPSHYIDVKEMSI